MNIKRLVIMGLSLIVIALVTILPEYIRLQSNILHKESLADSVKNTYLAALNLDAYKRQNLTISYSSASLKEIYSKRDVSKVIEFLNHSQHSLNVSHIQNQDTTFYSISRFQLSANGTLEDIRAILNFVFVELSKTDLFYTIEPSKIEIVQKVDYAKLKATFDLVYKK